MILRLDTAAATAISIDDLLQIGRSRGEALAFGTDGRRLRFMDEPAQRLAEVA